MRDIVDSFFMHIVWLNFLQYLCIPHPSNWYGRNRIQPIIFNGRVTRSL